MSYFKNTPESLLEKVKEIQKETELQESNKFTSTYGPQEKMEKILYSKWKRI